MKLLLDTHTAIWFVTDSNNLPGYSKKLIQNAGNECYISTATLWEMGIKHSLGKLKLKAELEKILNYSLKAGLVYCLLLRIIY